MDLIKAQAWKAAKTLPWYVAIPLVLVGSFVLVTVLFVSEPAGYNYNSELTVLKAAAALGFTVWMFRQAIRVLWTAWLLTHRATSEQTLRPR